MCNLNFLLQNMRWHAKGPNLLFLTRLDCQCWRRYFQSRGTAAFVVWAGQWVEGEQVALEKTGGVIPEAPTLGVKVSLHVLWVCCRLDVHIQGHCEAAGLSLGRVKWCPRNFTSCLSRAHSSADVAPEYFSVARFPFSYIVLTQWLKTSLLWITKVQHRTWPMAAQVGPKGAAIC